MRVFLSKPAGGRDTWTRVVSPPCPIPAQAIIDHGQPPGPGICERAQPRSPALPSQPVVLVQILKWAKPSQQENPCLSCTLGHSIITWFFYTEFWCVLLHSIIVAIGKQYSVLWTYGMEKICKYRYHVAMLLSSNTWGKGHG